jgi:hypothetical protein
LIKDLPGFANPAGLRQTTDNIRAMRGKDFAI